MRSHLCKRGDVIKTILVLTGLVYSGKRADDRKIEKIEKNNKILPTTQRKRGFVLLCILDTACDTGYDGLTNSMYARVMCELNDK
jgi:hypothetical protein